MIVTSRRSLPESASGRRAANKVSSPQRVTSADPYCNGLGIESLEDQPAQLLDQLSHHTLKLDRFIRDAARRDTAVHEVEQEIWRRILALGRETVQAARSRPADGLYIFRVSCTFWSVSCTFWE